MYGVFNETVILGGVFELSDGTTWSGDVGSNTFDQLRLCNSVGASPVNQFDGRFSTLIITKNKTFNELKTYAQTRWPNI